jgi:hypothetical protein
MRRKILPSQLIIYLLYIYVRDLSREKDSSLRYGRLLSDVTGIAISVLLLFCELFDLFYVQTKPFGNTAAILRVSFVEE